MVEAPNHVLRLRKAADEMRHENQNGWPLTCDAAADEIENLQRQIADLRAERDEFAVTVVNLAGQRDTAEADNARLRALPLKDEVVRVLEQAKVVLQGEATGRTWYEQTAEALEDVDALLSRLRAGEQKGWRSMDSAPKDGTEILLHGRIYSPSIDAGKVSTVIGYWTDINGGGWVWYGALSTVWTHWQPLPAAPSDQGGDRG